MRQARRAHHQAEHQREKVAPRELERFLLFGAALGVARKRLAVARQASEGSGALVVVAHFAGPQLARGDGVARQFDQLAAGGHDQPHIGIGGAQALNPLAGRRALLLQRSGHIGQPRLVLLGTLQIGLLHLALCGRGQQLLFQLGNLANLRAVFHGRNRIAQLLVRQPRHGNQKRQQDDHVLRHLRPGDRAHAAQKRAQQHAAEAQHDADLELHAGQARGDQAHTVDLRHHIGERAQHRRHRRNHARPATTEAHLEEIGNRVEVHRPQMRRNQHRDQAETAGPAQQIGEPTRMPGQARKSLQIQRARQADERRRTHPVGRRRHAVVERRNTPPGDVILFGIGGPAVHADTGIGHHRQKQKDRADPMARETALLGPCQRSNETQHANDVERQNARQTSGIGAAACALAAAALTHRKLRLK